MAALAAEERSHHELDGLPEAVLGGARSGARPPARPHRTDEPVRQPTCSGVRRACDHGHQRPLPVSGHRALGRVRLGGDRHVELQAARPGVAGARFRRPLRQSRIQRRPRLGRVSAHPPVPAHRAQAADAPLRHRLGLVRRHGRHHSLHRARLSAVDLDDEDPWNDWLYVLNWRGAEAQAVSSPTVPGCAGALSGNGFDMFVPPEQATMRRKPGKMSGAAGRSRSCRNRLRDNR